jgi:energy-coupling factor transporter ATP-binding protein EcfA2
MELDRFEPQHKGRGLGVVPYIEWERFVEGWEFKQGEHVTLVGGSGSGKTTLARQLVLPRRDFVVVMATKKSDDSLYGPLQQAGFEITDHFDPYDHDHPKIIFKPSISGVGRSGRENQAEMFGEALQGIFEAESWCVYCDEVRYLSDNLGLAVELETLWMQGRSLGISMVVGAQRPVKIPVIAYDANHLFLWKATDKRDVDTMSEFTGTNINVAREVIPRLPRHEALYIQTVSDETARTKVRL